jgi:LysR family nitrogen assimilation transcriptional regulator
MTSENASDIDLKQLHYFLAIVQHGSLAAAAGALGLAQSTLSEALVKLEAKLDTPLAVRGPRGLMLTEAGLALASEGKDLIDRASALASRVRDIGGRDRGSVSVGLPPTLSLLLSVPLAETVHSEQPDIRLHLAEGLSGHVIEWIEAGKVDFGFAYDRPNSPALQSEEVFREELFLIAAPDFLPSGLQQGRTGTSIRFPDLCRLPLVMQSRLHGSRRVLETLAASAGCALNIVNEMDSLPQIIEMVVRASAYAVVPLPAVATSVAAGQLSLVRIVEPACVRTAYLVRRRSRPVTTAVAVVERALLSILQELVERRRLQVHLTLRAGHL